MFAKIVTAFELGQICSLQYKLCFRILLKLPLLSPIIRISLRKSYEEHQNTSVEPLRHSSRNLQDSIIRLHFSQKSFERQKNRKQESISSFITKGLGHQGSIGRAPESLLRYNATTVYSYNITFIRYSFHGKT